VQQRPGALAALLLAGLAVGCTREAPPGGAPPAAKTHRQLVALDGPWRLLESDDLTSAEAPDFDDRDWTEVRLPHTWGARSRAWSWYRTRLKLAPEDLRGRLYLRFEAAAASAEVFLNGQRLGAHLGAYTAFVLDATSAARAGDNLLAVQVSNDPLDQWGSLPEGTGKQLYHVYGGLHRRAWLLKTAPLHVDPTDHASSGVYATPREVSARSALLEVRALLRNAGPRPERARARIHLLDGDGRPAAEAESAVSLEPGSSGEAKVSLRVPKPRLWSPRDPHLYHLRVELLDGAGATVDAVEERTGIREFRYDNGRFLLNGEELLLRGIGKHEEDERRHSALTEAELVADFDLLKELGVNMVRLAHYPHPARAYELADERGLLVWAENGHSNRAAGPGDAADRITREMIRQNYNHPSIVLWSVGNENAFTRVARLSELARAEDPWRPVTYASNTGKRNRKRLPDLDFIAENTYRGWYRGEPWEFEEFALRMAFIAENGAGSVVSNHTDYELAHRVLDQFEPEEYRQRMAEVQYQVVFRDQPRRIPMYLVWILRDFRIDKYKGWNTKGLVTAGGLRKDAFYLYQSFLRPELPVVHITSKTYFLRRGDPENGIRVYSNLPRLELFVNGESLGTRENGAFAHHEGRRIDNVFHWRTHLRNGRSDVRVTDGAGHEDTAVVHYSPPAAPPNPSPAGAPIAELRSSNPQSPAFFIDAPQQEQWPFYFELDGTADNTFDALPPELRGSSWISTPRLSKPGHATSLSFRLTADAEVFVVTGPKGPLPDTLRGAGFADLGWNGEWRGDDMQLTACRAFRLSSRAGDVLRLPRMGADAVVLIKRRGQAQPAR